MKTNLSKNFRTVLQKDANNDYFFFELPFNPYSEFEIKDESLFVNLLINESKFYSQIIKLEDNKFIIIFNNSFIKKHPEFYDQIELDVQLNLIYKEENEPSNIVLKEGQMDVLKAISSRQSIRKFTSQQIDKESLELILHAGLCAPTARNRRPYHFILISDKDVLTQIAAGNKYATMLNTASHAIVVCGDSNVELLPEFIYSDCFAATQNILLAVHGLGLGAVWCGILENSGWKSLIGNLLKLPLNVEPISLIVLGHKNEEKALAKHWDPQKIHFDKW